MSATLAALLATSILAVVAVLLVAGELTDHRMADRVRRAAQGTAPPVREQRRLANIGFTVARLIDLAGPARFLASPQDRTQIERTLAPLGVPIAVAGPLLVAVKLVFLVGGPAAAAAWHFGTDRPGNPMVSLMIGLGAGVVLPNMILSQMRKRRIANLNRAMADTFDMLVVCSEAGLGLESAIDRVAADLRHANPAMALEFAQLGQEMRMMPDRTVAMERFAERAEVDGLRRLAATLSQAMRYGTPLGQALRTLAAEERQTRLIRLEEKAARLPTLLVLPLILFILPPLFLTLVGPSIMQLFDAVGNM
ncbi:type II secretion system F family protein [Falsiroseomonas oryzae]|uniref:type II secretion system F family protein n=1 Tax=Falsiroseomonas oryzae TaxID=2766473 RepID=UPI0022EA9B7E|nr:type II secretion system F family protein [Roseomonas sp. MO-31]